MKSKKLYCFHRDMTEMISYKVTELELEIVNLYFEMSLRVLFCIIRPFGRGGGLHYTFPDIFPRLKEYS